NVILIRNARVVRSSWGPPTGLPATKLNPVTMLSTRPSTPIGTKRSSDAIGMPLPIPSIRASTRPTVPMIAAIPKKCRISQTGQTQSWVATKLSRPVFSNRWEIVSTIGVRPSVAEEHANPLLDEVRVFDEAARADRKRPKDDRCDRETMRLGRNTGAVDHGRSIEHADLRELEVDHRAKNHRELHVEHPIVAVVREVRGEQRQPRESNA